MCKEEDEEMGNIDVFYRQRKERNLNLASEIYLLFCHFLLFQLEWEIYNTYSLTIGLVHFTLINFNVMMNKL